MDHKLADHNYKQKSPISNINANWHLAHRMPKNPTLDQRVTWHLEHARNCHCRALGGKILAEIQKRGIKV